MMKQIVLWFIAALILSTAASATLSDKNESLRVEYNFNATDTNGTSNIIDRSGNGITGVGTSITSGWASPVGEGWGLAAVSSRVTTGKSAATLNMDGGKNKTIAIFARFNTWSVNLRVWSVGTDADTQVVRMLHTATAGAIKMGFNDETTIASCATGTDVSWGLLTFVYNGTHAVVFVNDTLQCQAAKSNLNTGGGQNLAIGDEDPTGNLAPKFNVTHFCAWNQSLTKEEVGQLYGNITGTSTLSSSFCKGTGGGGGGGGGDGGPKNTTLSVNALYHWNDTAILNFTVTVHNETHTRTNSTTTGNVTFGVLANLTTYRVNISSNYSGGFYNVTYNVTANLTTSLTARLWQSEVVVNGTEAFLLTRLDAYNVSVDEKEGGRARNSSTSNLTRLYLKSGVWTLRASSEGLWNQTITVNVSALSTVTVRANLSFALYNVTVQEKLTNKTISNFTVHIRGINFSDYSELFLSNSSNGTNYFLLSNASWTFNVTASGFATTIKNLSSIRTEPSLNITIFLFATNTLYITINDEDINDIINKTINTTTNPIRLELVSTDFSSNYSTQISHFNISNLQSGNYELRYQDNDKLMAKRENYFLLINSSFVEITIYLLNVSLTSTLTHTVTDQNNRELEGATIKALRYYPATNAYVTVEMSKTNFLGKAQHRLKSNGPYYKFFIDYANKNIFESKGTIIFDTVYSFRVNTISGFLDDVIGSENIGARLYYDNATGSFRFTYSDPGSTVKTANLDVWVRTSGGDTQRCDESANSASATLICNINGTNESGTYLGIASIDTQAGRTLSAGSISMTFGGPLSTFGAYGAFLSFMLILGMTLIGLYNPAVGIAFMLLAVIITATLGMLTLTLGGIVGIIALGMILITRMKT